MTPARLSACLIVALGIGFAAGYGLKDSPVAFIPSSHRPEDPAASPGKRRSASAASSRSAAEPGNPEALIEARFSREVHALRSLPDAEFARRMAGLWGSRDSPGNLFQKALFAAACDSGKAMAFYEEFKRGKGLSAHDEGGTALWDFLFQAGKRFGGDFVLQMTGSHPDGTRELDTIVHGWVSTDATRAVEWLNSLPEDCPYYSKALKGIVWGIGETAPDFAVRTFFSLPEEERREKFQSLGGGAVNGRGITGLVEIAAQFPEPADREKLLMGSLIHSMGRPPAEFVTGMAGQLSSVPRLSGPFQQMAGRWVKSSPTEAIAWLDQNAGAADQAPALGLMAVQLSQAGHADAVDAWLAAHPQSPARAAVQEARGKREGE